MKGFTFVNPFDFVGSLSSGAKGTATCRLDMFFGGKPTDYPKLLITVSAKYTTPIGISFCKSASFDGIRTSEGTFIWTYHGSPDCSRYVK